MLVRYTTYQCHVATPIHHRVESRPNESIDHEVQNARLCSVPQKEHIFPSTVELNLGHR